MKSKFQSKLKVLGSLFFDTAPIIYYIEAHPTHGFPLKEALDSLQSPYQTIFTFMVTITEVLPRPVSLKNEDLIKKFLYFLKKGRNIIFVEISSSIAEQAGRPREKYKYLKTIGVIIIK